MKDKISLLIPYYQATGKNEVLNACLTSFSDKVDQLLVNMDNSKSQYAKLNEMVDSSDGDYLIIANDDTTYISGDLKDLCVPDTVTHPLINDQSRGTHCHIFCVPRKILDEARKLNNGKAFDDRYEHGYFDDDDFIKTVEKLGYTHRVIETVNIGHPPHGGTTLDKMPDRNRFFESNKLKFMQKWQ